MFICFFSLKQKNNNIKTSLSVKKQLTKDTSGAQLTWSFKNSTKCSPCACEETLIRRILHHSVLTVIGTSGSIGEVRKRMKNKIQSKVYRLTSFVVHITDVDVAQFYLSAPAWQQNTASPHMHHTCGRSVTVPTATDVQFSNIFGFFIFISY